MQLEGHYRYTIRRYFKEKVGNILNILLKMGGQMVLKA